MLATGGLQHVMHCLHPDPLVHEQVHVSALDEPSRYFAGDSLTKCVGVIL